MIISMETSNSMLDCDKLFIVDFLALDKLIAEKKRLEYESIRKAAASFNN
jgi:hypothetical protein